MTDPKITPISKAQQRRALGRALAAWYELKDVPPIAFGPHRLEAERVIKDLARLWSVVLFDVTVPIMDEVIREKVDLMLGEDTDSE
jgi:hypothetical protein